MQIRHLQKKFGFTLLEIVIVVIIVGIIATIAIPIFSSLLDSSRVRITRSNMAEIERAIIGDPSTNFLGFRQVMHTNPDPLSQLWNMAASSFNPFSGMGLRAPFADPSVEKDGWNETIAWNPSTSTLTSGGKDQTIGSGGDDIVKIVGAGEE